MKNLLKIMIITLSVSIISLNNFGSMVMAQDIKSAVSEAEYFCERAPDNSYGLFHSSNPKIAVSKGHTLRSCGEVVF